MPGFKVIDQPTRIPVPGGKLIEEFIGRVNTQSDAFSLAHMVAPPGWGEPRQTPQFTEVTIMLRGRMEAKMGEHTVVLEAGQVLITEPGESVQYGNPFAEESEYWAICLPAFSPDLAQRDA